MYIVFCGAYETGMNKKTKTWLQIPFSEMDLNCEFSVLEGNRIANLNFKCNCLVILFRMTNSSVHIGQ